MSDVIEVGSIVEGKVVKIKPFGAIVLLPNNIQGLVHISHISSSFVQNIADHLEIGDTVKVKVLSIDQENNKIALSIKEASENKRPHRDNAVNFNDNKTQNKSDNANTFEDKLKEWIKLSNDRQAGLNKRNKRR